jgi:hypothetical protein
MLSVNTNMLDCHYLRDLEKDNDKRHVTAQKSRSTLPGSDGTWSQSSKRALVVATSQCNVELLRIWTLASRRIMRDTKIASCGQKCEQWPPSRVEAFES